MVGAWIYEAGPTVDTSIMQPIVVGDWLVHGIATLHTRRLTAANSVTRSLSEVSDGRWRIVTALEPFGHRILPRPRVHRDLRTALVVLGHTRWATQGVRSLTNASPMAYGDILGTHNGDVRVRPNLAREGTDSEWLFGQLDRARSLRSTTAVLTGLRGRAALARKAFLRAELRLPGQGGSLAAGGGGRPGGRIVGGLPTPRGDV